MSPSPIPPDIPVRSAWLITSDGRPVVACWSHGEAVLQAAILSGLVPRLRIVPNPAAVLLALGQWNREDRDELVATLWSMTVADPRGVSRRGE